MKCIIPKGRVAWWLQPAVFQRSGVRKGDSVAETWGLSEDAAGGVGRCAMVLLVEVVGVG